MTSVSGMANLALNRCVEVGPEFVSPYDPDMYINFDYTFLDDTYTPYQLRQQQMRHNLQHKIPEANNLETGKCVACKYRFHGVQKTRVIHPMHLNRRERLHCGIN